MPQGPSGAWLRGQPAGNNQEALHNHKGGKWGAIESYAFLLSSLPSTMRTEM